MLVDNSEKLVLAVERLSRLSELSVDTETTGLEWYKSDRPFSIIIGDEDEQFYIDLKCFTDKEIRCLQTKLFDDESKTWYVQNGKFDLHMLRRENLGIKGKIIDNWFLERLHNNRHQSYSMKNMGPRWGYEKGGDLVEYCSEHGLKKVVRNEILNKEKTIFFFDQIPLDVVVPYAETDVKVTFGTAKKILQSLSSFDEISPKNAKSFKNVVDNESKLLKTITAMEKRGVLVDLDYCEEAREYYAGKIREAESDFKGITGRDFSKGPTLFKDVFGDEIEKWTYTSKGNPEFDLYALKRFKNPAANAVIAYSQAKKQLEYFQNFLYFADSEGVVHCDYKQAGTDTNRLSCSDPNLQNLTKPDKYEKSVLNDPYPVRRALIPRMGKKFVMLDFDQVEYRVMLDIAKAEGLIEKIKGGLDVHAATALISGTTRTQAKTTNFLSLYGGGIAKLCDDLFGLTIGLPEAKALWKNECGWRLQGEEKGIFSKLTASQRESNLPNLRKAKEIQDSIFKAAPEIKQFSDRAIKTAKERGYLFDFLGRRYSFPDKQFAYKAPNHLIQGSCASALKVAMNGVFTYLKDTKSHLLLTIHDELVIEVDEKDNERQLIGDVRKIMESAYPWVSLPTTVGIEYSEKSLADKLDW